MRVRHEIRLAVAALLGLQLITAIAGSWLLLRTGPAIRHILAENDVSLEAVEQMRAVIARRGLAPLEEAPREGAPIEEAPLEEAPLEDAQTATFTAALTRARNNITEPAEPAAIEIIEARAAAALAGDPTARAAVLEALDTLSTINRTSMHEAGESAHRLARGGAWSLVGLALSTLALGLMMIRRVRDRLSAPLARLYRVALAWTRGDPHPRCGIAAMPEELAVVAQTLDALLDATHRRPPGADATAQRDRNALHALLTTFDGPALVLHEETVLAANTDGLALTRVMGDATAVERSDLGGGMVLVRGKA